MPRAAATLAALVAVLAAAALLAALLLPNPGARAVQSGPPPQAAQEAHTAAVDPFLADLVGPGEVPDNAADLLAAADRVCEGFTADVPVIDMESALAGQLHITLPEAHDLVEAASEFRC